MRKAIKLALAGMLATSSLSGVALAQMATPSEDNVTVVQISTLNNDTSRGEYERLTLIATDPVQVQEAQAEVAADPTLESHLVASNVQLNNIVEVETAANGGKIVYVR